jgi:hypothetical protein
VTAAPAITDLIKSKTSYSKSLYLIAYSHHCISCTAVHTNDTDFTQQVGVLNRQFLYTELSVFDGVFVLVFCVLQDYTRIHCARPGAEGDIWTEAIGSSRGMNKIAQ